MTADLRGTKPAVVGQGRRPRVLIIIQNLAVPFDRRVWLECQSLRDAGYDVTVVCPAGHDSVPHRVLDDIEIYTYRPYAPGGGAAAFVAEYAYSFAATARLVLKARRRSGAFDVMQACNPPDIFWPLARLLRRPRRHPLRLRPPRSVPGAVPVALPRPADPGLRRPRAPRADDLPDRRPGHLDQRVVRRGRPAPWREGGRARDGRPYRPGPAAAVQRAPKPRRYGVVESTWWPTSG